MLGWEIALILGSFAIMSIFSAYAQQKITKNYAVALAERIEELNAALGEAIESILGGEMGMAMEPPNPIMGIVAQILSNSLEKPLTTPIQGEDGKFVKKIVEKIS